MTRIHRAARNRGLKFRNEFINLREDSKDLYVNIDSKTKKSIPALAYVAIDQGRVIANNIYNLLSAKKLEQYRPNYKTWIAPVGGKFALVHFWRGRSVSGFAGWIIRELVDLQYLVSILSFRKAIALFVQEITMFTKND